MGSCLNVLVAQWLSSSRGSNSRDGGRSGNAFHDLAREIIHHHYFIGQQASLDSVCEGTTPEHEKTRTRKWRTFWRLATTQASIYFWLSKFWFSSNLLLFFLTSNASLQTLFPICSLLLIMDSSDSFSRPSKTIFILSQYQADQKASHDSPH